MHQATEGVLDGAKVETSRAASNKDKKLGGPSATPWKHDVTMTNQASHYVSCVLFALPGIFKHTTYRKLLHGTGT
jgi:hypothetical protein